MSYDSIVSKIYNDNNLEEELSDSVDFDTFTEFYFYVKDNYNNSKYKHFIETLDVVMENQLINEKLVTRDMYYFYGIIHLF